jgi:subtilisin
MTAAQSTEMTRVIVVFKPKNQRSDSVRDKRDILRDLIAPDREIAFFEAASQPLGGLQSFFGRSNAGIGLDVNRFDTPILCLSVTADERERLLAERGNIDIVEDEIYFRHAGGTAAHELRVEGRIDLAQETIPKGVDHIGAPAAWGNSQGKGIRVALLDTGIDSSHPDLSANVVGGVCFVEGNPSDRDDEGHGTFCAGIVGAALNGSGLVGVAPQASLYSVKVCDQTGDWSLTSVIAGLDWCIRNRMHIISMSFGTPEPRFSLYLMCQKAWQEGALLLASVGNGSGSVEFPAAFDNVVGVAAIQDDNSHYPQSNCGPAVDICAPGVRILSTGPAGTYRTMSGTSAACPHVAGAAALAWGSHRFSTNQGIWNLLAWSARALGDEEKFGRGRVNAYGASAAMLAPEDSKIRGSALAVGLDGAGYRVAYEVNGPTPKEHCANLT